MVTDHLSSDFGVDREKGPVMRREWELEDLIVDHAFPGRRIADPQRPDSPP